VFATTEVCSMLQMSVLWPETVPLMCTECTKLLLKHAQHKRSLAVLLRALPAAGAAPSCAVCLCCRGPGQLE
jgi:hypothetical protein